MTTNTAFWSADKLQQENTRATISGLLRRLRQNWARRRTHLLLADLDDRTLDDIGLEVGRTRRSRTGMVDWVVQSHSGTARLVFIGR